MTNGLLFKLEEVAEVVEVCDCGTKELVVELGLLLW